MRIFFLLCVCVGINLQAVQPKKTVCLNMIVKNESPVIETCLASIKPYIDHWVIVDTGSTDGTQDVIKQFLKDIPGEIYERPWVDFAHNRNEALELAKGKGDYVLLIDADEMWQCDPGFALPNLEKDYYFVTVRQIGQIDFKRMGLIKMGLDWVWKGVLHELVNSPKAKTFADINGVFNICNVSVGARGRDPDHFLKDVKVLENALKKDPSDSRSAFYIGQSYLNAKKYDLALESYKKRAAMPSNDMQETYLTLYMIGIIQETTDFDAALESFYKTYLFRPIRAEPLYRMAKIYRQKGNYLLSYLLSQYAMTYFFPKSEVVVEEVVYHYLLPEEFAHAALLLGKYQECIDTCNRLLSLSQLPEDVKADVISHRAMAKAKQLVLNNTSF